MRAVLLSVFLASASCGARIAPPPARVPRSEPERPAKPQAIEVPREVPAVRLPAPPVVRVLLTRTAAAQGARVRVKRAWTLVAENGATLRSGKSLDADLSLAGTDATLAGAWFPADAELRPAVDGDLRIDTVTAGRTESRVYPGALRIERGTGGRWLPKIATDVETYVAAVVNAEIPATFPRQAQRTQAIIARSYAFSSTHRTAPDAPLELADIGGIDQEFTGLANLPEHRRIGLDAAESTAGLVLTEEGAPFVTYYHSTCGGVTCPASVVFGTSENIRALGGGIVCPWCVTSKYYNWSAKLGGAEVVQAAGLAGTLESFSVAETTAGGRAMSFDVRAGGKSKHVRAAELRLRIGASALRSVLVDEATIADGELIVTGRGWGHGAGLCQMGAKTLAEKGLTAEAILAMYYPGASLEPRWQPR